MVKFDYVGLVFGSSQFLLLPQLPQKMMLALHHLALLVVIRNALCRLYFCALSVILIILDTLGQACQTQNTVRAAKGIFMPKKLSAGRS